MTAQIYDVVVIGAGPAGENVADYATRDSARTALMDRARAGGRRMLLLRLHSEQGDAAPDRGAHHRPAPRRLSSQISLDVAAVLARRDYWVSDYSDTRQETSARGAGIDIARGTGRLAGERRVQITSGDGTREVEARLRCRRRDRVEPGDPGCLRPRDAVDVQGRDRGWEVTGVDRRDRRGCRLRRGLPLAGGAGREGHAAGTR